MAKLPLIEEIKIHNYKSLRNISFRPGPLSVLIGPNASGKSNFVDALDFFRAMYQSDLESAIRLKHGYENICFRDSRRSPSGIQMSIRANIPSDGLLPLFVNWNGNNNDFQISFNHLFEFTNDTQSDFSPYRIKKENITIKLPVSPEENKFTNFLEFKRSKDSIVTIPNKPGDIDKSIINNNISFEIPDWIRDLPFSKLFGIEKNDQTDQANLILQNMKSKRLLYDRIKTFLSINNPISFIKLYAMSIERARRNSDPISNPVLEVDGGNLPSMIHYLMNNEKEIFSVLEETLLSVLPQFDDFEVKPADHNKLSLWLKEKDCGKPWNALQLSDGTISMIALLVAILDPRESFVVIEEPENSLHPWALRSFIKACRKASKHKQIVITTHSPIVWDMLYPNEIFVVSRKEHETSIDRLTDLDPEVEAKWKEGEILLWDYLDGGLVPNAVP